MAVQPVRLFGDPVLRTRAAETRKQAMREIRQAQWFGAAVPVIKTSPHPMLGKVR